MYLGTYQATFAARKDKWLPGIGTISVSSGETIQQKFALYRCEHCGHEPEILGKATENFFCRECGKEISIAPASGDILAARLLRERSNLPWELIGAFDWEEDPRHPGVWQANLSKRPNWKVVVQLEVGEFVTGTFECSTAIEDASHEQLQRAGEEESI